MPHLGAIHSITLEQKKHSPRIVYRIGKQDGQIQGFLEYRKFIKNIVRLVEKQLEYNGQIETIH